jgi:excisionase family DNA binding protein
MNPCDEMLLLPEVAQATRVSIATVRYWIRTGKLKALRPGRRCLVRRGDLEGFLRASDLPYRALNKTRLLALESREGVTTSTDHAGSANAGGTT